MMRSSCYAKRAHEITLLLVVVSLAVCGEEV